MPTTTIAASQVSQPVVVGAGSIVTVTPGTGATATVEYTGGSATDIGNGVAVWKVWAKGAVSAATKDFCADAAFLRVTAQGGVVSVDVNAAPSAADIAGFTADWGVSSVQISVDASGNIAGLQSAGGVIPSYKFAFGNTRRALRVVPFGDSITRGSSSASTAGSWILDTNSPVGAIYMSGRGYEIPANAGVSGNTTAQMRARINSDVIAQSPDVVTLLAGTNDLYSGMTNADYASMMNNIESMVIQLLRAGILPAIITPPPKNAAALESRKAQFFYYDLARKYRLPLFDMYRLMVDPTTGNYNASYSLDGTHPNFAGWDVILPAMATWLGNIESTAASAYMAAYSETAAGQYANLMRNGNFARVTTPPTPDGQFGTFTNCTVTSPAASGGFNGNTFTVQVNAPVTNQNIGAMASVNAGSGFAVGDVILYSGRVKASGFSSSSAGGFTAQIYLNGTAGYVAAPIGSGRHTGDMTFAQMFTVPPNTTALSPQFLVNDVGTYELNNLTLFNVTAARAIWQPGQQI